MLLRDITKGADPQIAATLAVIAHINPDILVLTDFDYDLDGLAMAAFADRLGFLPHQFSLRPNTGLFTGLDIDGNGRLGEARDGQGYGRFAGDGGMAILSRFVINPSQVRDLSDVLWKDLPGATLPRDERGPFPSTEVLDILRLSSNGHWIVPISPPQGPAFSIMAYSATPPVFDGAEDMNGLRNSDELRLWKVVLQGGYGPTPDSFVIAGNANLDPQDGQGLSDEMMQFLANPSLKDPLWGKDTADWPESGPGNLRVSYVLPSADWQITDAGVFWPAADDPFASLLGDDGIAAGPHHLVWVDISR